MRIARCRAATFAASPALVTQLDGRLRTVLGSMGGDAQPQIVLLTNGRGGMARLCVDFGNITSKYDCLLGANLDPNLPVDRHVFAKRARLWVVADGFVGNIVLKTAESLGYTMMHLLKSELTATPDAKSR